MDKYLDAARTKSKRSRSLRTPTPSGRVPPLQFVSIRRAAAARSQSTSDPASLPTAAGAPLQISSIASKRRLARPDLPANDLRHNMAPLATASTALEPAPQPAVEPDPQPAAAATDALIPLAPATPHADFLPPPAAAAGPPPPPPNAAVAAPSTPLEEGGVLMSKGARRRHRAKASRQLHADRMAHSHGMQDRLLALLEQRGPPPAAPPPAPYAYGAPWGLLPPAHYAPLATYPYLLAGAAPPPPDPPAAPAPPAPTRRGSPMARRASPATSPSRSRSRSRTRDTRSDRRKDSHRARLPGATATTVAAPTPRLDAAKPGLGTTLHLGGLHRGPAGTARPRDPGAASPHPAAAARRPPPSRRPLSWWSAAGCPLRPSPARPPRRDTPHRTRPRPRRPAALGGQTPDGLGRLPPRVRRAGRGPFDMRSREETGQARRPLRPCVALPRPRHGPPHHRAALGPPSATPRHFT